MGFYVDKAGIKDADGIKDRVTAVHLTSDAATPANITNSLGSVSVTSGDFSWSDVSATNQALVLAVKTITATGAGTSRHLVGWDGTSVVFATPVAAKNITSGYGYDTPTGLAVANISVRT